MNYPLTELSAHSRIWVFTSSTIIENETAARLLNETSAFLDSWLAHKVALKAAAILLHDQILLIAVDESQAGASGCSIDKLHHFIKEQEKNFHIQLLDRMRVVYKKDSMFFNVSLNEFKELITSGKVNPFTIVLNTLIETLDSLKTNFELPLHKTWLNRFLPAHQHES